MSEPARNHVARVTETPVAANPPTSMLDILAQAVRDPSLDVDRLVQLTGLYERLSDRQAETFYNEAMNAAQEEMRPVAADANNPQTKSKYASYRALDRALRPIYSKHGFSLSFDTADGAPAEYVRVVCRVAHQCGHKEIPHLDMPADGKGAKGGDVMTKTHAIGAAITYGKRYLLGMIFNISVGADDDDGNGNGGREMGEVAKRTMEEINGFETAADLVLWKKNKSAGAMKMVSEAEGREIVALWNRRAAAMGRDNG